MNSRGHVRRLATLSGAPGFALGASYVWRGFRTWSRSPRLMAWGLLPGVITVLLVAGVLLALAYNVGDAAHWVADQVAAQAGGPVAAVLWILVVVALVGGALIAVFYSFTALTLFIGQPFFERISREVDAGLGAPVVAPGEPWWRVTLRGLAEALRLLALTAVVAFSLFLISLIPVAGTVAAFVLGAFFGGWLLALELTAYSLSRRGTLTLRERRRRLASQRSVSAGFGVAVFLLFLVPFGAIATMPAAAVGATLLTRRLHGEADTSDPHTPASTPMGDRAES